MDAAAQITVTEGPDEGKEFSLSDELVHIGRGVDNQIVLSDPALNEHQASIVRRNGRYAIYTPSDGDVEVEGSAIPAEKWVWLPDTATIRLGAETALRLKLSASPNGDGGEAEETSTPTPTPRTAKFKSPRTSKKSEAKPRKGKDSRKRSHVAKFVSDRSGAPLVQLGEDGQLPALELKEVTEEKPRETREKPKSSNPLLLYAALGFSFVASLGLLLLEPELGGSTSDRSADRAVVRQFLGEREDEFEPYQVELRQALVDHSQGDFRSERNHYRRVLRMLNSADIVDPENHNGLTGHLTGRGRAGDDDLRRALKALLAE